MGGVLGRLFHEFAVVMTSAILISLLVSLTTTPMMCALLLPAQPSPPIKKRGTTLLARGYRRSLAWALRHQWLMWLVLIATIGLNISLYRAIPKGFFPQQDTGRINGYIRADQSSSFLAMQQRLQSMLAIVQADPAVLNVTGFTGNSQRNAAQMFMTLKPRHERDEVPALFLRVPAESFGKFAVPPSREVFGLCRVILHRGPVKADRSLERVNDFGGSGGHFFRRDAPPQKG
jgi:multidrug efflux pump